MFQARGEDSKGSGDEDAEDASRRRSIEKKRKEVPNSTLALLVSLAVRTRVCLVHLATPATKGSLVCTAAGE